MNLREHAESNDNKALLRALRERLADAIDNCESARDISSMSKQLMDVVKMLDGVDVPESQGKGTVLDELRARRQAKTGS